MILIGQSMHVWSYVAKSSILIVFSFVFKLVTRMLHYTSQWTLYWLLNFANVTLPLPVLVLCLSLYL